jgi:hypothetical protein
MNTNKQTNKQNRYTTPLDVKRNAGDIITHYCVENVEIH